MAAAAAGCPLSGAGDLPEVGLQWVVGGIASEETSLEEWAGQVGIQLGVEVEEAEAAAAAAAAEVEVEVKLPGASGNSLSALLADGALGINLGRVARLALGVVEGKLHGQAAPP